jgi:hypothetical protein
MKVQAWQGSSPQFTGEVPEHQVALNITPLGAEVEDKDQRPWCVWAHAGALPTCRKNADRLQSTADALGFLNIPPTAPSSCSALAANSGPPCHWLWNVTWKTSADFVGEGGESQLPCICQGTVC